MNASILFRKKATPTKDGPDGLRGDDEITDLIHCARRNTTGRVGVGAILLRALVAALDGNVTEAAASTGGHSVLTYLRSTTSPAPPLSPRLRRRPPAVGRSQLCPEIPPNNPVTPVQMKNVDANKEVHQT